jgi:hypothetical protein
MKPDTREKSEEVLAVKVPRNLAAEIKRRAREDDRTVSAFLRRKLTATIQASDADSE